MFFLKKIINLFIQIIFAFFSLTWLCTFFSSTQKSVEPTSIQINSNQTELHGTYDKNGWADIGLSVHVCPIEAQKNVKLNIINDTTPNQAISIKNNIIYWSPIKQENVFSFSIFACSIFNENIYYSLNLTISIEKQKPERITVNYSKDYNIYSELYKKGEDKDGILLYSIEPSDSKEEVVWSIISQTTPKGEIFLNDDNKICWNEIYSPNIYQFVIRATSVYDELVYGEKTFYLHINDQWKSNYLPIETLNIQNNNLLGFKTGISFNEYKEVCDTLYIPSYIEKIPDRAFTSSIPEFIEKIEFQTDSLIQSIGTNAFSKNNSIENIQLNNCVNLSFIGEGAFSSCNILDFSINSKNNFFGIATNCGSAKCLVRKKNNISKISKENGIVGCLACGKILIDESNDFDLVPELAFAYCYGITSIDFSCQKIELTNISMYAFYDCISLTEVVLETKYINIIDKFAFANCISLTLFNFFNLENLTSIGEKAFAECRSLKQIDLSKCINLQEICSFSFYNCQNLSFFSFHTNKLEIIGEGCFFNCKLLNNLLFWGLDDAPTFSVFSSAFFGISKSGVVSSNGQYTSQQLLNWLQGKDGTGIKGDFPIDSWYYS